MFSKHFTVDYRSKWYVATLEKLFFTLNKHEATIMIKGLFTVMFNLPLTAVNRMYENQVNFI